jgi:hypothetical protein
MAYDTMSYPTQSLAITLLAMVFDVSQPRDTQAYPNLTITLVAVMFQ